MLALSTGAFRPNAYEEKASDCLAALRRQCVQVGANQINKLQTRLFQYKKPGIYNAFIMGDLRDTLIDSGSSVHKKQLWQYLMHAKRKYRPITDEECAVCSFHRHKKSTFIQRVP